MQLGFAALVEKLTREKLSKKPELADLFVPDWGIGCRRYAPSLSPLFQSHILTPSSESATPGVGYLTAVQADNVDVVRGAVTRATKTGLIGTDGKERAYDVVILATGFYTTFAPAFKVTGLNGWSPNTSKEYLAEPSACEPPPFHPEVPLFDHLLLV